MIQGASVRTVLVRVASPSSSSSSALPYGIPSTTCQDPDTTTSGILRLRRHDPGDCPQSWRAMGPGHQSRLAVLASISLPALALVVVGVAWVRRVRRRKANNTSGCPPEPPGKLLGAAEPSEPGQVRHEDAVARSNSLAKAAEALVAEIAAQAQDLVASRTAEEVAVSSVEVDASAAIAEASSSESSAEVAEEATESSAVTAEEIPEVKEEVLAAEDAAGLESSSEATEEKVETPLISDSQVQPVETPLEVQNRQESIDDTESSDLSDLAQIVEEPVQLPHPLERHTLPETPPASPPPPECHRSPHSDSAIGTPIESDLSVDLDSAPVVEEPIKSTKLAPQQTEANGPTVAAQPPAQPPPPREKFISERVIITAGRDPPPKEMPTPVTQAPPVGKGGKKGKKNKRRRAVAVEGEQLAEKLASLELARSERDSANQSPCDGMLASPGAYSDVRSEGSSDSGKGHSDVATPATSLAGDPAPPTVFEFLVPQALVGRLIGRHGSFLQEIMALSHTNIFIKKHPDSNKLKICAIEGGQPDIDKALVIIRNKFPARRYPKLTLERVSFVNNEAAQLRAEDFYLTLVEGVNNDVVVSSLMTAGQLFIQQPSHPSYLALTSLTQAMGAAYSDPVCPPPPIVNAIKDAVCVAPSMGGWYRVQIVDAGADVCQIKFVDYGGYLTVETALLRQIRGDFLMLPFQAVECVLANVQPIGDAWSEEARLYVHHLTFGRVLQAFVCGYAPETGVPLVKLFTSFANQVVLVNDELVRCGFAHYVEDEDVYTDEDIVSEEPQPIAAE